MMVFLSMIALGAVIGFVGAGGAGVTIALLTVGFGVPIHTALAVALASMVFTVLSGTISHFREHEVEVKTGAVLGMGGIVGAFVGANVSNLMKSDDLSLATAVMMLVSAFLLYMKLYHGDFIVKHFHGATELLTGRKMYIYGIIFGTINGFLSGAFGIGAAAFIQLTLLIVFGVPLLKSVGTCMMVILPISAAGGLGYLFNGRLELMLFVETLFGLMIGAYGGAKLTHLAPLPILRICMVGMSAIGGIIMLFGR